MSTNLNVLAASGAPVNEAQQESVHTLILAGKERLQDLVRQSTMSIQESLAEIREMVSKCEAELDVTEEINVVIELDRAVLSVKRSVRFAKDRP